MSDDAVWFFLAALLCALAFMLGYAKSNDDARDRFAEACVRSGGIPIPTHGHNLACLPGTNLPRSGM